MLQQMSNPQLLQLAMELWDQRKLDRFIDVVDVLRTRGYRYVESAIRDMH